MGLSAKKDRPNVADLMEQIRERVRAELKNHTEEMPRFKPRPSDFGEGKTVAVGRLAASEDLLFLNRNYSLPGTINPAAITSHRSNFFGKVIVKGKRFLAKIIKETILKDYLAQQQEFYIHLVRYLNSVSTYVDLRDGDIFWQLISKIDTDVSKVAERGERIRTELLGAVQTLEASVNRSVETSVNQINTSLGQSLALQQQQQSALKTLDAVVRGLEGVAADWGRPNGSESSASSAGVQPPDLSYVLLENRFRGSQNDIRDRQALYVEYFRTASKPVLDVGCGRGELLELLRAAKIPARGIDLDAAMIAECKKKNLDVEQADLLGFLRNLPDASLGGIIALQVVEHLPNAVLTEFIALAKKKIAAGGLVIFETINPTSLTALSSNYFRDPTHVFPQHPDTLGYMLTLAGIELVETKYLAPVPESAKLRELTTELAMTPRWSETVTLLNHNIRLLNSLLFGYQDFCIVGRI